MGNKMWKTGPLLLALTLALAALGPAEAASQEEGRALWEETIFLGEAVPLRRKGQTLEEALRSRFSEPGEAECWWMSPQGPLPLEELGKQRPREDGEIPLSAVLRRPDGRETWVHETCRVHVASGSVRVWAEAESEGAGAASQALVKLEGAGLTLYRQAQPDAGPQGGVPALEAEFTGLPYGRYTLSVVGGGLEPGRVECLLGVCREDDTVDPDRRTALIRFKASGGTASAVRESDRLGGGA